MTDTNTQRDPLWPNGPRPTCRNDQNPVYLQGLCSSCWAAPAPAPVHWVDVPGRYASRQDALAASRDVDGRTRVTTREAYPGRPVYIVQQPDTRRVLRGNGCQHPGLSDAQVLAEHDASPPDRRGLYCTADCVHLTGGTHTCGWWYTHENEDGDVEMIDEPYGAGND